jgi:hypothetical protein
MSNDISSGRSVCYKEMRKGKGQKREVIKQETKMYTQGADPGTQADTEHNRSGKAALEHKPTETKIRNNHIQQNPKQARPPRPPAQTRNANPRQRHKTAIKQEKRKGATGVMFPVKQS